jgi:hypothetical protein
VKRRSSRGPRRTAERAIGLIRRQEFERSFHHERWDIVDRAGDFLLIQTRPSALAIALRKGKTPMMRILVVEDEKKLAMLIRKALREGGICGGRFAQRRRSARTRQQHAL